MTTIYITEYNSMARGSVRSDVAAPQTPAVAKQQIALGTMSQPFNADTRFIMVTSDALAFFDISDAPDATANPDRISPGERLYFGVIAGHKLAAVAGA